MSAMSDYLEQKLIDHLFDADGAGAYTPASDYWVELFTVAVSDAGSGGTPVSGAGYSRSNNNTAKGSANWTRAAGVVSNAKVITFGTPGANWGVVVGVGRYDAASSGNLILHGTLTNSKTINNGDPAPKFNIGELKVTLA